MLSYYFSLNRYHLLVLPRNPSYMKLTKVFGGVYINSVVFVKKMLHNVVPYDALADAVAHVGNVEYYWNMGHYAVVALAMGYNELLVDSPENLRYVLLYRFFLDVVMAKLVGVGDNVAAYQLFIIVEGHQVDSAISYQILYKSASNF